MKLKYLCVNLILPPSIQHNCWERSEGGEIKRVYNILLGALLVGEIQSATKCHFFLCPPVTIERI